MDGVVEIITGRERRRRWSTEEKRRIVKESTEPGAVMRAVAARNGICESLLHAWRRQIRDGTLRERETPSVCSGADIRRTDESDVVYKRGGTAIVHPPGDAVRPD